MPVTSRCWRGPPATPPPPCLFFRTVLSPGSDATHQDHLHLDVLERKGGYLYCR